MAESEEATRFVTLLWNYIETTLLCQGPVNGKNKFSILMRSEMSGDMGMLFHMIMNVSLAAQFDFTHYISMSYLILVTFQPPSWPKLAKCVNKMFFHCPRPKSQKNTKNGTVLVFWVIFGDFGRAERKKNFSIRTWKYNGESNTGGNKSRNLCHRGLRYEFLGTKSGPFHWSCSLMYSCSIT